MASLQASSCRFAAFKSGPQHRRSSLVSHPTSRGIGVRASAGSAVDAETATVRRQATHHVETAIATLVASGILAGSCFAADSPDSAAQAVQAAKLASDILRPLFNIFTILYIVRVPMTWYPDIDGTKMPWLIAYAPTEPILSATRKVVPLVSGVDVSPIVWVGLISFFNEILLGPQGLLTLIQARGGL